MMESLLIRHARAAPESAGQQKQALTGSRAVSAAIQAGMTFVDAQSIESCRACDAGKFSVAWVLQTNREHANNAPKVFARNARDKHFVCACLVISRGGGQQACDDCIVGSYSDESEAMSCKTQTRKVSAEQHITLLSGM